MSLNVNTYSTFGEFRAITYPIVSLQKIQEGYGHVEGNSTKLLTNVRWTSEVFSLKLLLTVQGCEVFQTTIFPQFSYVYVECSLDNPTEIFITKWLQKFTEQWLLFPKLKIPQMFCRDT